MQPKKYYGGPKAFRMAGKVDKSKDVHHECDRWTELQK